MYYVVYGFFWLLSLLPLRVLYLLSDGVYGLIFYVFKYRRDVAMKNLGIAFPEKTEAEKLKIAKKFYHNLVDTFIETIKMVTVSTRFMEKRIRCNWEVINQFHATGKSVQIHIGHNFNWEWGNAVIAGNTPYQVLVVYMPIASKVFEKFLYRLRTRAGTVLLPATNMRESFLPYRNKQYLMGLAADQNPGHPGNAWWVNFFGRPTPFVKGPAKAALANQTAVVFAYIHKPRRGHYNAVVSVPDIDLSKATEQELTLAFVRYLETVIREYPEMWLWSHRRWKWDWKPEYGEIIA